MVTDSGTYASLPESRIEAMDGKNARFKISGGGKYQVSFIKSTKLIRSFLKKIMKSAVCKVVVFLGLVRYYGFH